MADLGSNIRNLREAFGETQLEMAHALGFDSPATISMYESGDRGSRNYEVISKIAHHFRITENRLIHGDFSEWNMEEFPPHGERLLEKVLYEVFPLFSTEEDEMDSGFRQGFAIHMDLFGKIRGRKKITKKEVFSCLEAYDQSELPIAAANSIWWLLLYGTMISFEGVIEGLQLLMANKISKKEFFRDHYLRGYGPEVLEAELARERKRNRYFQEFGDRLDSTLRDLYICDDWGPQAHYYMALQYTLGLVRNDRSEDENMEIGREMMKRLADMGNLHARGCLRVAQLHKV